MAQVSLLDVNVLVALFDADHVHHDLVHDWFGDHRSEGWATCPLTENGFLRVVSSPRYRPDAVRPGVALESLRKFCSSGGHHFWGETVSFRDSRIFNVAGGLGHQQLTDVYLLGLAKHMSGRLATLDRTIPLTAVRGARQDLLALIAP